MRENAKNIVDQVKSLNKPITNADLIRSMTDEELAWELARICRMPFYKDDSEIEEYEVDFWEKLLRQEAVNDR